VSPKGEPQHSWKSRGLKEKPTSILSSPDAPINIDSGSTWIYSRIHNNVYVERRGEGGSVLKEAFTLYLSTGKRLRTNIA
jgi:hypothetical protein